MAEGDEIIKVIAGVDLSTGSTAKGVHELADAVERLQNEADAAKKSGKGLDDATRKLAEAQRQLVAATLGAGKAIKDGKTSTDGLAKSTNDNTAATGKSISSFQALRKEIREYKSAAIAAGVETPVGQKFIKLAAEATDRMKDLNQEVLNISKDTRVFDSVAQGAQTFTAVMQVGQGVIAQFGGNSKDLQETLVKLQGTQAILSGLIEIQNALQKESALITGIRRAQTFLMTGATVGMTAAEVIATVATNALNFAVKSLFLPLTALVVVIGILYEAYKALKPSHEFEEKALQKEREEMRLLKIATEAYISTSERLLGLRVKQFENQIKIAKEAGANELTLLRLTQRSITEQIAAKEAEVQQRLKFLNAQKGITNEQIKNDEVFAAKSQEIADLKAEGQLAELAFTKKISDDSVKVKEDENKKIFELIKNINQVKIDLIQNDRERELAKLNDGFDEKMADLKRQGAEEKKIRTELAKAQEQLNLRAAVKDTFTKEELKSFNKAQKDLNAAFSANKKVKQALQDESDALTKEKEKALQDFSRKILIEDEQNELNHIQTLDSLNKNHLADRLSAIEVEAQKEEEIATNQAEGNAILEAQLADKILKIHKERDDKINNALLADTNRNAKNISDEIALQKTPFLAKFALIDRLKEEQIKAAQVQFDIDQDQIARDNAIAKANEDAGKAKIALLDEANNKLKEGIGFANEAIQIEIDGVNQQIQLQQDRVDKIHKIAEKGNAEELQLEQERLDALNAKKAKFVRQQQALALVQLIAESAVAIVKAVAAASDIPFPGNLIAIGVSIASIVASLAIGIAKARATAQAGAFAEGVIDLRGPGSEKSDSINARLSRGESVMTAKETREFKPTLMAIRKGMASPEMLNRMSTTGIVDKMLSFPVSTKSMSYDNSNLESRLERVAEILTGLPAEMGRYISNTSLNITEKGIYSVVKKVEKRQQEVNKRAR